MPSKSSSRPSTSRHNMPKGGNETVGKTINAFPRHNSTDHLDAKEQVQQKKFHKLRRPRISAPEAKSNSTITPPLDMAKLDHPFERWLHQSPEDEPFDNIGAVIRDSEQRWYDTYNVAAITSTIDDQLGGTADKGH